MVIFQPLIHRGGNRYGVWRSVGTNRDMGVILREETMLFTIVFPIWTLFLCAIGPFVGAYTERPEGNQKGNSWV